MKQIDVPPGLPQARSQAPAFEIPSDVDIEYPVDRLPTLAWCSHVALPPGNRVAIQFTYMVFRHPVSLGIRVVVSRG